MIYNWLIYGKDYKHHHTSGGLWNSRKVATWMSEFLEPRVSKQRGWEYLRSYELRLKQPRPAHVHSDPFEQELWKKNFKRDIKNYVETIPSPQ